MTTGKNKRVSSKKVSSASSSVEETYEKWAVTKYSSMMIRLCSESLNYLPSIILSFSKHYSLMATQCDIFCNLGLYSAVKEDRDGADGLGEIVTLKNRRFKARLYAPGASQVRFFAITNDQVQICECTPRRGNQDYFQQKDNLRANQKGTNFQLGWVVVIGESVYIQIVDGLTILSLVDSGTVLKSRGYASVSDSRGDPIDMDRDAPPSSRIFPGIELTPINRVLSESDISKNAPCNTDLLRQVLLLYTASLKPEFINNDMIKRLESSIKDCTRLIREEMYSSLDLESCAECATESEDN